MLVKDYMTRHPIMIEEGTRVIEAQKIMAQNNIRHLPVVGSGKRLTGLVTRQRLMLPPETLGSLDVWEIARYLSDMTVAKVMLKGTELHTITPEATLEEAAELMMRHKVGGLPVIDEGDNTGIVCGIITDTDLLVELQNLLGAQDAGYRVVIRVPDRMGEFRKLVRVISDKGWGIMAMGSVRAPKVPDKWDIVLKVRHASKGDLLLTLREIPDQEIMDIRETGGATS
jgi:acetoin utilization protein AcuB